MLKDNCVHKIHLELKQDFRSAFFFFKWRDMLNYTMMQSARMKEKSSIRELLQNKWYGFFHK